MDILKWGDGNHEFHDEPRRITFSILKLIKTYSCGNYSVVVSHDRIYFSGTLSYDDINTFTEIRFFDKK